MTWVFFFTEASVHPGFDQNANMKCSALNCCDTDMSCSPTDIFVTSFCDFLFHQIKLVSKPLWEKDGKWHIVGSTVTQETIAFFHIGKPLRSYKCHLQQREYLLQYKARAKTPQKKFYFLNWYILEPLFSAHTILFLPSPRLQNHRSNFITSPLTFAKVKNIAKIFELELIYLKVMLTFIHPCQLNRYSKFYCFKVHFSFIL